ncbi:cryptochrome/photolyase family protein [Robiginitalea marina]|uniref:DNA photolyase family protein n=1 Tax=Robiginitalea marina TaxID=2954105 RepID=A0ABT1ATY3_9FLAO|nr:DNA photolyase family protein [Robiginitalea marina]
MQQPVSIFWFRRDLRLEDNHGLLRALSAGFPVIPLFIFDPEILGELPRTDARVGFIHQQLQEMDRVLKQSGCAMQVRQGTPLEVFRDMLAEYEVKAVFTNRDYEPYARERDGEIESLLRHSGIPFHTFKDQVIFEMGEISKEKGDPYVVYTPYMKKWKAVFRTAGPIQAFPSEDRLSGFFKGGEQGFPSLQEIGFTPSPLKVPAYNLSGTLVENYERTRNIPAVEGTSRLGPHLRFGTISIRKALKKALEAKNETFWNELIWREFFMQILWHFPHTAREAFKKPYDRIAWRNREEDFELWKNGQTGYALVDAGMRQLNQTGYMHNRVRMLTASFLCKHLLIDWRWGEAYFAEKLLDYEMSSNVGNWQWAAGSGVDAAPYFRIFNPITQAEKFDPRHQYIRQWVPEYGSPDYPPKMVEHTSARNRCLETYKAALG